MDNNNNSSFTDHFQTAYDLLLDERHCRYSCPVTTCAHHGDKNFTSSQMIAHLQTHTEMMVLNTLSETLRMEYIIHKSLSAKRLKLADD